MHSKLLQDHAGRRTFALVFETGDEVFSGLTGFAREQQLTAAEFSGIGALSNVVLTFFDWETKSYQRNPVEEQVEVASLNGDVALDPEGTPAIHAHIVVGKRDGTALAGHLAEAHVRPTLEVVVTELPAHLHKRHDPQTGLALIHPEAG